MDRQTAHLTFRDHRESGWLAAIGLHRCAAGCGHWPCNAWLTARDRRDRQWADGAVLAAMTDRIGRPPGDQLARYLSRPNRGPR